MSYSTNAEGRSGKQAYTLEEALDKIYLLKQWISIPKVLVGKRVKLMLVEDGEKQE